jgi:hypothetical protein
LTAGNTIKKIIGIVLLAVFAFGITPKRTLHNLVADHRDGKAVASKASCDDTVLSRAAFNCQCDNLVVESPFVPGIAPVAPELPVHTICCQTIFKQDACPAALFHSDLRGPPHTA